MKRFSSLLTTSLWAALLITGAARATEPTKGYPEPVVQWGVQKDETYRKNLIRDLTSEARSRGRKH